MNCACVRGWKKKNVCTFVDELGFFFLYLRESKVWRRKNERICGGMLLRVSLGVSMNDVLLAGGERTA